jgi:hypothetical protein
MRVPFHVYWRQDAALLAQLPIEGTPLFDAALSLRARRSRRRCRADRRATPARVRAGDVSPLVVATYRGTFTIVLGACAALLPAIVVWTASLVAHDGAPGRSARRPGSWA